MFRLPPQLPNHAMKTYSISAPQDSHWRSADCAEIGCKVSEAGFMVKVDEASNLGVRQAAYIRHKAGRPYKERREAGLTVFVFPPGSKCFQEHRVRVGRPELYIVRGGDWRGKIGQPRVHDSPEHWVEDFAEHQERLSKAQR